MQVKPLKIPDIIKPIRQTKASYQTLSADKVGIIIPSHAGTLEYHALFTYLFNDKRVAVHIIIDCCDLYIYT